MTKLADLETPQLLWPDDIGGGLDQRTETPPRGLWLPGLGKARLAKLQATLARGTVPASAVLARSYTHFGHAYSTSGRFGPNAYDCSGHIWATLRDLGLGGFPQSSATQYAACFKISLTQAFYIPGALIFMPANPLLGVGPHGHVAFSRGNGWTSEARGHAWGVGSWPINGRGFSAKAGLIPGVDYGSGSGGGAPTPPNIRDVIKATAYLTLLKVADGPALGEMANDTAAGGYAHGPEVGAWQDALNLTMRAGLAVNWTFGPWERGWTAEFQKDINALEGHNVVPAPPYAGGVEGSTRSYMVKALENLIDTV